MNYSFLHTPTPRFPLIYFTFIQLLGRILVGELEGVKVNGGSNVLEGDSGMLLTSFWNVPGVAIT